MYKDLGTIMITGGIGTGKTTFIKKYIDEIIEQGKNNIIYIVDLKMVELLEYKGKDNIIYINDFEEIEKKLLTPINNTKSNIKSYIFIDEYAEIRVNEVMHKNIKRLIYQRDYLNLEVIITSQNSKSFCNGMRTKSDTIINLNKRY